MWGWQQWQQTFLGGTNEVRHIYKAVIGILLQGTSNQSRDLKG